ncbi:MAG: phosphopantetheine-binding protein [Phycisphaeraceae bacterium]|nr:phosphopantetheine-binding protein [Phycisphaeraceae bacterium]
MSEVTGQADLTDKVRQLIRRDLKLADDIELDDQTPLFDGSLDLDSLDALLLVSSIEKAFGVKIPNEAIGQQVFANIASLVAYLQEQPAASTGPVPAAAGAAVQTDLGELVRNLPHGPGFRFVSRLSEWQGGSHGSGVWELSGQEPFFADHFPGRPLVPGVLLTEALAQLSGLVAFAGSDDGKPARPAQLAHSDIRFLKPVEPPVQVELISRLDKTLGDLRQFSVQAKVDGEPVAEGHISLAASD